MGDGLLVMRQLVRWRDDPMARWPDHPMARSPEHSITTEPILKITLWFLLPSPDQLVPERQPFSHHSSSGVRKTSDRLTVFWPCHMTDKLRTKVLRSITFR